MKECKYEARIPKFLDSAKKAVKRMKLQYIFFIQFLIHLKVANYWSCYFHIATKKIILPKNRKISDCVTFLRLCIPCTFFLVCLINESVSCSFSNFKNCTNDYVIEEYNVLSSLSCIQSGHHICCNLILLSKNN